MKFERICLGLMPSPYGDKEILGKQVPLAVFPLLDRGIHLRIISVYGVFPIEQYPVHAEGYPRFLDRISVVDRDGHLSINLPILHSELPYVPIRWVRIDI